MGIKRNRRHSTEVGYFLINSNWGNGYGTEMIRGCMDIAFKTLRLHRVEAAIDKDNVPSIKIAGKLGMRRECLRKKDFFIGGRWVDSVIYVLLEEDWGVKPHRRLMMNNLKARY